MKRLTAVLLCLLLCGCGRAAPAVSPETTPAVPVAAELYDPHHPMEQENSGLLRAYPLTVPDVQGMLTLGKHVLLLSGGEQTTLTLFTGDRLRETARIPLAFSLRQDDPSLQIHENGISFFDPVNRETLLLDHRLQIIRRITAPDGLSGMPILSPDGTILYYCTGWSVMAWDLETGIRRTVKELSHEHQEMTALLLGGSILECTVRDNGLTRKLLLSAHQGQELGVLPEDSLLGSGEERYFAVLPSGYQTLLIFGKPEEAPELLLPNRLWQQQFYLPEDHAAVTVHAAPEGTQLDYYELNTGILRSSLNLKTTEPPKSIANSKDHRVYILTKDPQTNGDILYRWDVLRQPPDTGNITSYKTDYPSAKDPKVLEACRDYAKAIGEAYGITVCVWEDAVKTQPWDYRFQPETLAPVLQKELKLLEQRLARYPEGVLQQTRDHFASLTICLVRQISGTGDSRSLNAATGIQFFQDREAYVVITTGAYSEQALYHELYHVMETHILTESTGLDSWEALNPAGFSYGSSQQDSDVYLRGQTRAFVDRYSMGAVKEDRARILENAMLPERKELFQSEYMQRKLRAMCTGIREAYRLENHPQALPWEQYLVNPWNAQ